MAANHQMSDAEARANLAKAKLTGLPDSATMFQLTNGTDAQGVLPYGAGTGNVGVYPYGCDLCTGRNLPGCASIDYPPADTVAQTQSICQVQRGAQYQIGSIVNILLVQCPYP